jgi:hypothetical protein
MSVSAVGSGAGYVPYVTPQVTATAAQPAVAKSQATDADGDHDGSTGSSGRLDMKG